MWRNNNFSNIIHGLIGHDCIYVWHTGVEKMCGEVAGSIRVTGCGVEEDYDTLVRKIFQYDWLGILFVGIFIMIFDWMMKNDAMTVVYCLFVFLLYFVWWRAPRKFGLLYVEVLFVRAPRKLGLLYVYVFFVKCFVFDLSPTWLMVDLINPKYLYFWLWISM